MARMIPEIPHPDCRSDGEKKLYGELVKSPIASRWTVLHSLWLANHPTQRAGEADFVLVVPGLGVLVVEVKGCHSVEIMESGGWRYGQAGKLDFRGPFRQASQAMYSIQAEVTRAVPALKPVLFWSAVVFTDCHFAVNSTEWHTWQVLDKRSLLAGTVVGDLRRVLEEGTALVERKKFAWFDPKAAQPTPTQCDQIAGVLRPTYQPFHTPAERASEVRGDVRRATDDQLRILDCCASSDRLFVEGPAGTGKTLLAISAVERQILSSPKTERTLFLCFNSWLKGWIEEAFKPIVASVDVFTLHGLMMKIAGVESLPEEPSKEYWSETLPALALDRLLEDDTGTWLWDHLVVDEAQDLLADNYRDIIDLVLRGGLRNGRWRIFGDFERQAIFADSRHELLASRERVSSLGVPLSLRDNCRNTPSIAHLAEQLGGLSPGYRRVLRGDDGRSYRLAYFETQTEQVSILESILEKLKDDQFADEDIAILSTRAFENSVAARLARRWRRRFQPKEEPLGRGLVASSVHRFKGLERDAVILTDVQVQDLKLGQDLFYTGTTRARSSLSVLCHSSVKPEIGRLMADYLSRLTK